MAKAIRVQFKKGNDGSLSVGYIAGRHSSRMEVILQARALETAAVEKEFAELLRGYRRELAKVEARYKTRTRRLFEEREELTARLNSGQYVYKSPKERT